MPRRRAWRAFGVVCVVVAMAGALPVRAAGPLTICHAGSLQAAFTAVEKLFAARAPGVEIADVSGGSVALAARMAAGEPPCDVYGAADYLNIDLILKPAGLADFTVVFARGRMVLAYTSTDPLARDVATGEYAPPSILPSVTREGFLRLLEPGVRISGSHPFLDPAGYRSHMIFQLAQTFYDVPNLANRLLEHYTILPAVGGPDAGRTLGRDFNFQFTYEHSAAAAARNDAMYRYARLPDAIDLSSSANRQRYARAAVTIPGIGTPVTLPGAPVAWGVTLASKSPRRDQAIAFLQVLLGPSGLEALKATGPAPLDRPFVNRKDLARLPAVLRPLVSGGDAF